MTNREFLLHVYYVLTNTKQLDAISLELLNEVNQRIDLLSKSSNEDMMMKIYTEVCNAYKLTPDFVLTKKSSRDAPFPEIRQTCWLLWFIRIGKYPTIYGNFFSKSHSSVIAGVKRLLDTLQTGRQYNAEFQIRLKEVLTSSDLEAIRTWKAS